MLSHDFLIMKFGSHCQKIYRQAQSVFCRQLSTQGSLDTSTVVRSEACVRSRGSSEDLCQPEKFNSLVISSKPDFMTTSKTMPKSPIIKVWPELIGDDDRWLIVDSDFLPGYMALDRLANKKTP